jgi:hypothetical protein
VVDVEVGTRLRADQRVPFACRAARLAQWGLVNPRQWLIGRSASLKRVREFE